MRSFLLKHSVKFQVIFIISLTVATAFITACIFQQFFDTHQLKTNTDIISTVYQVLGTIYAILLTFTLWGVWQSYTEADTAVQKEAYALLDLVHVIETSSRWKEFNIRGAALNYAKTVVNEEWITLRDTTSSVINIREQNFSSSIKIVQEVQNIIPNGERELTIFLKR